MSTLRRLPSTTLRRNNNIYRAVSSTYTCRSYSKDVIKEDDIVLLKHKTNSSLAPLLTSPLRAGNATSILSPRDSIPHDAILGKAVRDEVKTRKGASYRILQPTLGEYTDMCPRIVTPIYSQDANLIVSLLDIDPTVPDPNSPEHDRLEVFEAGTGHGALTLHLARAIHWANRAPPKPLGLDDHATKTAFDLVEARRLIFETAYTQWHNNRRAVIHTLDSSRRHSDHARQVAKNFRRGIYYPHIDWHVGSIDETLSSRLVETGGIPFLDHAILDLPNIQHYIEIIGKALKPNGSLITFCPSVTQISSGLIFTRKNNLPLFLERVVEVGNAVGVGGREWDVRPVRPKVLLMAKTEALEHAVNLEETSSLLKDPGKGSQVNAMELSGSEIPSSLGTDWELVCRPKTGLRISGGGFVGLWRKMTHTNV